MMNKIITYLLDLYAILFANKFFLKINKFIVHMGMRGLGVGNFGDKIGGEVYLINYIKRKYRLETIFDVGANQGNYTANFVNDKSIKVFCFEPNLKTFKELKKRFQNNDNFKLIPLGLTEKKGTAYIYDSNDYPSGALASMFKDVFVNIHHNSYTRRDISLTTLDEVVKEYSIEKINLLKIDVEGNEYNVLKGAREALNRGLIDIIQLEFNSMNVVSRVFMRDVKSILDKYNLYRLLPRGFIPIYENDDSPILNELFSYQNVVAFRKDIDFLIK